MLTHARKPKRRSSSKSTWEPESPSEVQSAHPDHHADLTPDTVRALQATHGNHYVQRLLAEKWESAAPVDVSQQSADHAVQRAEGDLPTIDHLSPLAQALLEGALEKTTIDGAVRQIYDNMFTKTGWKYNASITNVSGQSYVDGGQKVGMCESYRNTFGYILSLYDTLRKTHPLDAVKSGALDIERGDDLATERFYTKSGLTLMGDTAIKGNVYLQVDGAGNPVTDGINNIKTFIFKGHWTLIVNDVEYDPIFHSPGVSTLGATLNASYSDGTARFLPDTKKPIPTGEFGATFVHVTDFTAFNTLVLALAKFYTDNQVDVDWMLGSNFLQRWGKGIFKMKNADLVKRAKALVSGRVGNVATFMQTVEVANGTGVVTRAQKQALEKVLKLARV
jgi:hypothetical protein